MKGFGMLAVTASAPAATSDFLKSWMIWVVVAIIVIALVLVFIALRKSRKNDDGSAPQDPRNARGIGANHSERVSHTDQGAAEPKHTHGDGGETRGRHVK